MKRLFVTVVFAIACLALSNSPKAPAVAVEPVVDPIVEPVIAPPKAVIEEEVVIEDANGGLPSIDGVPIVAVEKKAEAKSVVGDHVVGDHSILHRLTLPHALPRPRGTDMKLPHALPRLRDGDGPIRKIIFRRRGC